MNLTDALTALYAASGVAACGFYAPQILRLAHSAAARRAMSLASWAGWLGLSLITVLYAALVVGQGEMLVVSGLNALCQAVVVALVAGQRRTDAQQTKKAGAISAPAHGAG